MTAHRGQLERMIWGVTSQASATREAPAQAELRPTFRRAYLRQVLPAPAPEHIKNA